MAKYKLGNIRGPRGPQGPPGRDGADGRTANLVTASENGLMRKEDKAKLDGVSEALLEIKKLYTEQNKAIDGNTTRLKNANNALERYL